MAKKIVSRTVLVDDLDGTEATQTVPFTFDGKHYEVDLNDEHASELRAALAGYMTVARTVRGRNGQPKNRKPASSQKRRTSGAPSSREVREWAKENKIKVKSSGPIPNEIRDKYLAAR